MSQFYAARGELSEAEECLKKAYELAKKFDLSPDYNAQNIKFYEGEKHIFSDDAGETAMESIEKIISEDENYADILKDLLRRITNNAD